MDKILCIESACQNISFAIKNGNQIYEVLIPKNQNDENELVYSNLDYLFLKSKLNKKDILAVAISNGPGSYTGLRIASSISKALCFSLKIPLISIDTLQILAKIGKDESPQSDFYLSLIDAGRQEVYANLFDVNLNPVKKTNNFIITEIEFKDLIGDLNNVFMIGNGAHKTSLVHSYPYTSTELSAKFMIDIASLKYESKEFENYIYHEPFYLKAANVG